MPRFNNKWIVCLFSAALALFILGAFTDVTSYQIEKATGLPNGRLVGRLAFGLATGFWGLSIGALLDIPLHGFLIAIFAPILAFFCYGILHAL